MTIEQRILEAMDKYFILIDPYYLCQLFPKGKEDFNPIQAAMEKVKKSVMNISEIETVDITPASYEVTTNAYEEWRSVVSFSWIEDGKIRTLHEPFYVVLFN